MVKGLDVSCDFLNPEERCALFVLSAARGPVVDIVD